MTVHVPGGIESEFNFPMFMYSKVWYAPLICLSVLKYTLQFSACLFTLIVNGFHYIFCVDWALGCICWYETSCPPAPLFEALAEGVMTVKVLRIAYFLPGFPRSVQN